ncbi:hypothetical protein OnM2_021068 [Erysiphe neolycopersici]|uniref:Uncharacterized protein n=1 Tax=Erysiphe neolycopersici TaxID=212602 RepID=A0A420I2Y2_9PEZI|nr:hypothetical protein OnM2_021068 [Erysiphe neolycopersici]
MLTRDNARTLRKFLKYLGVWVRNGRTYSMAQSLCDCNQPEFNVWQEKSNNEPKELKIEQYEKNNVLDLTKLEVLNIKPNIPNPTNYSQKQTNPEPHQGYMPPEQSLIPAIQH